MTKRELSQSQTAKPLQIQPPCPLSGILYFTCVILKCNSIFTSSSSNNSNSSDRNRKVRFNPLPSPVLFLWRNCAARLLYVPCFFSRHVQKICNEDPNLLILESNDSLLTEDDSLPLYQTSFSERNILRVTFLVPLFLFPFSNFQSIPELVRRVRRLERENHEKTAKSTQQTSLLSRCRDLTQQNERSLTQLRATLTESQTRQSQAIDHLTSSIQLLQSRLQVVTPRFEEISTLQQRNEALKQRIESIVREKATPIASVELEATLRSLERRVGELERRLNRVAAPCAKGKAKMTPPPLPTSPIPSIPSIPSIRRESEEEKGKKEEAKQEKTSRHFIPRLRKAFQTPKLPEFVLDAVKTRQDRSQTTREAQSQPSLVCTLPPYAKM